MTKQETLKKVKGMIAEGITVCEPIHMRIEENFKYERGDQWSKADAERQEMRERPAVPWNSVFKVTNAICNRDSSRRSWEESEQITALLTFWTKHVGGSANPASQNTSKASRSDQQE